MPRRKQKPRYTKYGLTQWLWLVRHRKNFQLGKNTEIGNFTVINCQDGVEIQDNVKVGYHCVISSRSTIDNRRGKIILKKNCNLGANSVVMPGVSIGENSIVGANSFVNRSIPPNEIWVGTPAKFLKKLKEKNKTV